MPGVKVFKAPGATFESSAVCAIGRSGVAALVSNSLQDSKGAVSLLLFLQGFSFPPRFDF
jgi:hypothetical protein